MRVSMIISSYMYMGCVCMYVTDLISLSMTPLSSLTHPMIIYTHPIAGVKTCLLRDDKQKTACVSTRILICTSQHIVRVH